MGTEVAAFSFLGEQSSGDALNCQSLAPPGGRQAAQPATVAKPVPAKGDTAGSCGALGQGLASKALYAKTVSSCASSCRYTRATRCGPRWNGALRWRSVLP